MKSNLLKSIFISLILVMGVSNTWAEPWLCRTTAGGNKGTKTVGDKLNNGINWEYTYTTNGGWSTGTDLQVYVGTSTSQYVAVNGYWKKDDGSNKQVGANIGEVEFDRSGKWYAVGKYKADGKTAYTTTNNTWTSNTTFSMGKNDEPYWVVNPPAVSNFSVSVTGHHSGSGTEADPYIVLYGESLNLELSGSKAKTDVNSTLQYNTSGTWNTTTSRTISNITSATNTSVTVKMRCHNSSASLSGTESSKTIYYRAEDVHTVTIKNDGHGTTNPTGAQSNVGQVTGLSIKATPAANYEFVNWTITSGSGSFGSETSASTTFKPTSAATIQANFRSTATHSLTVAAGEGIASVTGSTDPVTLNSTYPIIATPKTGYTFSTWTANPVGNATFGSATTANTTVTVKNGSVTVTATATENMSTLTTSNSYTEGNPGYAAPTASVNSIGYETTATVTATAAGNGYTFTGWTLTNCTRTDGGAADAISITVRSNGDGKAATVVANFEKIPPKTVYLKPKTEWKNNNPVIICDGTSTPVTPYDCAGEYYTAEVPGGTTNLKFGGNNETTLSLTIPQDDKVLYDMTSTNITKLYLKANSNWKADGARFAAYFFGNGDKWVSMTAVADQTDLYEVTIPTDKSYPSVIFCRMDGGNQTNGWSNKWNQTNDLTIPADGKNTAHLPSSIPSGNANVTWHKVWDNSCWTAYSAPTYTITTESGEGGTIEISPSSSVALNTEVTVTMTPNPGYSFLSGTIKIGNQDAKTITATTSTHEICGPTTITAEFESNIRTVTFDANGHGTEPEEQTINSGEKATEPAPLTEEGYTFGGWYTEKECTTQFDFNTEITENITLYAKWTEIKHTVTISAGENGTVSPSGEQQIGLGGLEVTATPKDKFRFTKWEVSGGALVADNYGATTTITATAAGTVIAHFGELQPKTIYLKTVEGTDDGVKWYVKYDDTEYLMDELGCTGEYYRGVVPEQTEFQLIAKDNGGNIITKETRDGLVVPDNSNMLNLVSLAAGGNKIFFKPNSHWLTKQNGKTPRFAAHFYNPNEEWIDLVDTNSDGIYECEKPAGGYTQIQFCRMKENTTENDWNNKSEQTLDLTIPTDGKNLFTVDADQELGGNNDSGTWSEFADTPVNGEGEWTIFEGATYRITFNHEGATSGTTTPGVAYVDAQHNSSMPVIELESLPKNTEWKFGGYYTAAVGGTAITNAFGDWLDADGYISNGKWVKEECVTLYAHWVEKTPEITNVTLGKDVFDVGSTETTTATPTVVPYAYQGTYSICWKLLDNSGTVMDLFPFTPGDNNSVSFSVDGLTSGTYTVRASIYASACDTGEELSRFDAKITIVSGYKVTVKYLCGDNVIQAPSIAPGHATTPVEIIAPEIGGYKFVNWELGDGIFSESDLNSPTISYTAIYDGYLTAKYEKRKLIFLDLSTLPNKDNWTEPHIYLYKGAKDEQTGGYWNDQTGAGGATGGNYITHAAMTKVPDTENIWYFDYEQYTNDFNVFVAFTSNNQGNVTHFANCEAIYRTEFSSGTPVFVPESDQTAETKNSTAKYYSKGYWVKYMDGTGYWIIIYNEAGDKELVRREFTSETQRMTMTSIVDLEAEHTYQYEIYRNDDYYYKGGDITYTNSSTYRPLNEANKHSIKTTETGDYTFTLDYSKGELQIKVQYPGEVGDYRILYTDDVRNGRYKPSQIISQNNKEPLVSFFIRPNDNPTLKVQSAAHITDGGVTWYTADNHIYFKPNDLWKSDNARFAAWFNGDKWKDLNKNGDVYSCEIPSGATEVIFCRMDPKKATNNWDNKWNQTGHLKLTTENLYTLNEGEWGNKLYLKPNSNWLQKDGNQKDPRFAAYFFNSNSDYEWVSMGNPVDGVYSCDIPAEVYKNVIFCRMNGGNETNEWSNKYNQSSDLTVPTDGKTLYTIKDGTWGEGSWSVKEGSWSTISGSITDFSVQLKNKLAELDLKNIKETEGSVFNIHLSNNEGILTIEKVAFYTGNFYIRVDAVDGKWYDYKTNPDNLMTYSAFSESDENSFGEKFSHYKTKWCTREKGDMNVKFVIANDYSLCISDTLTQDEGNPFGNIDEHGNITNEEKYDANIRFMWNRHTNKVSRAYVAGASGDNTRFLVLKADRTIRNESDQAINNNEVVFKDTENWLYERTIKVQPGTLVKLIAYYPDGNKAQYFRGTDANGFEENVSAVKILGGNNEEWYTMRIIYDFKTNRLMAAWVPDQKIDGTLAIDADIMVIRQHQEDATYITFANDKSQLSNVKTVYGVMRFNRWTLNNRSTSDHKVLPVQSQKTIYERALYFISFPFDVHLSDVFGFGTYGTHWVISEYNGLRRAQNGYFIDNCMNEDCTNWDYIWDPSNFTMKANQGYLLSLDLDLMKHDNESFWAHDIQQVELFFPSFAHVQTIQQTNYTMPALSEDYECKINFNKVGPEDPTYNPVNDHRVRDSYWRCIGVPSFADYNSALTTDGTDKITWNPKGSDLPFLYEWNVSDNSLMVRAATNYKFRSTFAYLVQNGNPIYWSAVNTKPSNIVARRQEAKRNYEWRITIARNGEVEDQAFVRLSDDEQVTTEFDFNQDLSKEFNYGRSDIYTLIGYEKAAANSLPLSEQTTLIPLGLSIEYNGDYTIAMPDGTANIGVTLIDTESNTRTNLSAGMEYTLTLKKGDYNNRFFIEISPIQQTPTDIEYVENSHDDQARKVLIDNILYIVRDGQMFDARGARLK